MNTIKRFISAFHAFEVYAENQGWHNNSKAKAFIKYAPTHDDEMKNRIYLSKDEIQALFDMPITGFDETVRDVFLIGCYTGLRYSDLSCITESCIGKTENGTPVIRINYCPVNETGHLLLQTKIAIFMRVTKSGRKS